MTDFGFLPRCPSPFPIAWGSLPLPLLVFERDLLLLLMLQLMILQICATLQVLDNTRLLVVLFLLGTSSLTSPRGVLSFHFRNFRVRVRVFLPSSYLFLWSTFESL